MPILRNQVRLFFYLLFYIFLFNGFIQGDRVVSCTKNNLHHHYSLHLQNWNALKCISNKVWGYLSFVLDQPNPVSHKHMQNYLHPSRWAFQAPLSRSFRWLWLLMHSSDTPSFKVGQVFLKGGPDTFPTWFFQGLPFLHLWTTLPFSKLCYASEEKLFFLPPQIYEKNVILSYLKWTWKYPMN